MADDVLRQGIQGISELITVPGMVNLDFADVRKIMSDAGPALMAIGVGKRREPRRRGRAQGDREPAARCGHRRRDRRALQHHRPRGHDAARSSTRPRASSRRWWTPRPRSSSAPAPTHRSSTRCTSRSWRPGFSGNRPMSMRQAVANAIDSRDPAPIRLADLHSSDRGPRPADGRGPADVPAEDLPESVGLEVRCGTEAGPAAMSGPLRFWRRAGVDGASVIGEFCQHLVHKCG